MAVENIKIEKELNDVISARAKMLDDHKSLYKDLISLAVGLREAHDEQNWDKVVDSISKTREALDEASESASKTTSRLGGIDASLNKSMQSLMGTGKAGKWMGGIFSKFVGKMGSDSAKSLAKSFAVLAAFIDGVWNQIRSLLAIFKSLLDLSGAIAKGFFRIGVSILAIPFRIFQGLLDLSDKWAQATLHIAQAYEEIRKQFGEFATGAAKTITGATKAIRGFGNALGESGLRAGQVFMDASEILKFFGEMATGMGPTFDLFGKEIEKNAGRMVVFQKGLGLSGEQMRSLAELSLISGKSLGDTLAEVTKFSEQLSETFGVTKKFVSRDMSDMAKDVGHFGNMSVQTMAQSSIYVRKLGLEIKTLGQIVDKFLNFEDAAENASKLSQAFGLNINALKMMQLASKDPAKALDELRRSFFATGRDASKMGTAELKLLAQTSGMSEEEARLAFSIKNRGRSMAEIRQEGEKTRKQELTQAQAMVKLADAVERFIRYIEMKGGLFQRFLQGFEDGIKMSGLFMESMRNLREVSTEVYFAGREIGKVFVEAFPGVKEMLTSFNEMFDAGKFKKFMGEVVETFRSFFDILSTDVDPETAIRNLFDRLEMAFKRTFGLEGPSKLESGFEKFLQGIGKMITGSIPIITEQIVMGLNMLIDLMAGKPLDGAVKDGAKKIESKSGKLIGDFLDPIVESLKTAWEEGGLKKAVFGFVLGLGNLLLKVMKDFMSSPEGAAITAGLIGFIFGPAMFRAAFMGIMMTVGPSIASGIMSLISKGLTLAWPLLVGFLSSPLGLAGLLVAGFAAALIAFAGTSVAISQGRDKFMKEFEEEFGEKSVEAQAASAAAGIVSAFSFGLISDRSAKKMGDNVGKFVKLFNDTLEKEFGTSWSFETVLSGILNVFEGVGDLIRGIFSKDVEKQSRGAQDIGRGIAKWLLGAIKWVMMDLPVIVPTLAIKFVAFLVKSLWKNLPILIAGFQLVFAKFLQAGANFLAGFAKGMGEVFADIPIFGSAIKRVFDLLGTSFENSAKQMQTVIDVFQVIFDSIKEKGLWKSLEDIWTIVSDKLIEIADLVWGKAKEVGQNISNGILEGLGDLREKMVQKMEEVVGGMKDFLGARSPSQLMRDEIGRSMGEGIGQGFSLSLPDVASKLSEMVDAKKIEDVVSGTSGMISNIIGEIRTMNDSLENIPNINVDLRLERIGKALGIQGDKLKIESKPIQITLNLNVVLEADMLAEALLETKLIAAAP